MKIELTKEEIIYLQRNIEFHGGYEWESLLVDDIQKKLDKAYKRPDLSKEEYNKKLEAYLSFWKDRVPENLLSQLLDTEVYRLRFQYNII